MDSLISFSNCQLNLESSLLLHVTDVTRSCLQLNEIKKKKKCSNRNSKYSEFLRKQQNYYKNEAPTILIKFPITCSFFF